MKIGLSLSVVAAVMVGGCGKSPVACHEAPLGPDVVLRSSSLQGMTGTITVVEVREDGRVTTTENPHRGKMAVRAEGRIDPARVRAFDEELTKTGIFEGRQGCWNRSRSVPDSGAATFSVRHAGRTYVYGGDDPEAMPAAVNRASPIVAGLERDARAATKVANEAQPQP